MNYKNKLLGILLLSSMNAFSQIGINTQNPQGIFNVDSKSSPNTINPNTGTPTALQGSDDFVITSSGSVGIGTTTPHSSAILDVNTTNAAAGSKKGFLGPKIALTSNTDQTTILNPAVGLLIYNLGTEPTFPIQGFLYWNGNEWIKFGTRTSVAGNISTLNCSNASLQPLTYQAGVPYQGTLIVPYTGGNGGSYSSSTPILSTGVTGLTAVLQPGDLEYGSGNLVYTITGTPSASSPNLANFTVGLGNTSCVATVGAREIKRGESEYFNGGKLLASTSGVLYSSVEEMPNIEDILRFDVYADHSSNGTGPVSITPRVYNISSSPIKIWWQGFTSVDGRGDGNVLLASGGYQDLDNGMYLGYGENDIATSTPRTAVSYANNAEGYSFDFIFNNKWYRVEMSFLVDNMNTSTPADNLRKWYCVITRMY